ncbi:integrase [Vibrio astriarenae]|nr:integrase [Vibrio sp. C7]
MYLYKHPNSVYYTRICTPKKLVKLGFPFDFKISLRTKSRPIGLRRNLLIAPVVVQSLDKWLGINEFTPSTINDCKKSLAESIEAVWATLDASENLSTTPQPSIHSSSNQQATKTTSAAKLPLESWLDEFIHSKKQQNITPLTVHQLNQRVTHFVTFYEHHTSSTMSSALFMAYLDHLQSEKRSPKTNKEFWAANKQFFRWLEAVEKIPHNPARKIKTSFRAHQHASEERLRWSTNELQLLLNHDDFRNGCPSVKWASLLQLYMLEALRSMSASSL